MTPEEQARWKYLRENRSTHRMRCGGAATRVETLKRVKKQKQDASNASESTSDEDVGGLKRRKTTKKGKADATRLTSDAWSDLAKLPGFLYGLTIEC